MESEGLEEILNKTNMLLMEKQARSDQNMFGFFIEGVLLVGIIKYYVEMLFNNLSFPGSGWSAWNSWQHVVHHLLLQEVKQEQLPPLDAGHRFV